MLMVAAPLIKRQIVIWIRHPDLIVVFFQNKGQ